MFTTDIIETKIDSTFAPHQVVLCRFTFFGLSGCGSTYCYLSYQEVTNCHNLNSNVLFITELKQNKVTQWYQAPSHSTEPYNLLLRVPACLAIIPHQSLKAFDWNKQLGVISQVQITLIQAHVARAGHDWVISQPVTLFITVINVSAAALWEGRNWWMEKHSVCVFQFLTSLLISSGQIVQYLTLIYFYGGFPTTESEAETPGKKQHEDELEKLFTKNSSLLIMSLQGLLFSTGHVNSNCFYLCRESMNDVKLYF